MSDLFVMRNEHSYAAFCGYLSSIYVKAFLTQKITKQPYKAILYANDSMFKPFNEFQNESAVDRIKYINSKFVPLEYGINFNIVKYNQKEIFGEVEKKLQGMTHTTSQSWMIKNDENKELITCNLPLEKWKNENRIIKSGRYFSKQDIEDYIIPDEYIDYNTPIERVFNILEKSKLHISYQGGTAWLSVLMNIPTLIVHNNPDVDLKDVYKHLKLTTFGQDAGPINFFDGKKIKNSLRHPSEKNVLLHQLREIKI